MKRFLLIIVLLMPLTSFAQEQTEKSSSKALEFLSKDGSFLKKEFYDQITIGSSYNRIDFQVLIVTEIKMNKTIGCLRLTTHYSSSSSSDDYIGTLDLDELDACIMCLEKIQSDIITTTPEIYTEAEYKTRDGVTLGAYWVQKKKEWVIYVQTKNYTTRSLSVVDAVNLPKVIQGLKDAKEIIVSKTK